MENNVNGRLNKSSLSMQKFVFKLLSKIKFGKLTIKDATGSYEFVGQEEKNAYNVVIDVANLEFYKKIMLYGSLGGAESYMHGDWDANDLTKLIELMIKNTELTNQMEGIYAQFLNAALRVVTGFKKNNIANAKKNILSHYDLGNEFFKLFLDPTMMYSCALFEDENATLEHASLTKLDYVCNQLELKPDDHILEIGTGWGGFAIHAARKYGCRVTTTTISDKQYSYAKQKIEKAGLQDKIKLLNQDYRQLSGQYDKLVSIEMIEAIGHQYFDSFFRQCNALLKTGGLFFLQAIIINERTYQNAKNRIDFIKKYIFPGGCLPSIHAMTDSIAKQTQLQLVQMRDIGKHYATTLLSWLDNFNKNINQVKQLGFSNEFIRMWRYYFYYCAGGFRQEYIGDIQGLWRKQPW